MMSGLPAQLLGDIWGLADTNKSGSLLFPEFALAMYLCGLALKGTPLPANLPDTISKEVTSFVDTISFNIPDETTPASIAPATTANTAANTAINAAPNTTSLTPNPSVYSSGLTASVTGFAPSTSTLPSQTSLSSIPQTQPTGAQSLPGHSQQLGINPVSTQASGGNFLASQPSSIAQQATGFTPTLQSQSTGYTPTLQAQSTGYKPALPTQSTGYTSTLQHQSTGFAPTLQAQTTGYVANLPVQSTGYTPALQSQTTGFAPTLQAQSTGYASTLQAQPTGRPGEWGFINTPGGGLPGMDKFQSRFMPQPGQENFTSTALEGNAKVEWAITKDEKRVYDKIFSEWDKNNKGIMPGDVAIKVLTQSGLSQKDLESIWTLSDPGNKGRLDKDEFAVAMHLIYRRLNNYPIPARLPPELIPPSSQNFSDSVSQVKSYLRTNTTINDGTSSVSYMKNRSFKTQSNPAIRKDATVFKNNDDEMVYRSSARHRSSRNKKTDSDEKEDKSRSTVNMSLADLRKLVHEKQILLDAIDARDEEEYDNVVNLEDKDLKIIEDLKSQIMSVQKEINKYPPLVLNLSDKKTALQRTLNSQKSKLPQLTQAVRSVEAEIAQLKLQLFRAKAEKENPGSTIVGTGPNGTITDSDRRKAKNRAMLKARMASLTGKSAPDAGANFEEFETKFAEEATRIAGEREKVEQTMRDIEESSVQISRDIQASLSGDGNEDTNPDREINRWEEGLGVEDDVKDLIYALGRLKPYSAPPSSSPKLSQTSPLSSTFSSLSATSSPAPAIKSVETLSRPTSSSPQPVQRTAAERAAYIKAEAKRRMNERLAAIGISRPSAKEPTESPAAREVPSTPPIPVTPPVVQASLSQIPSPVVSATPIVLDESIAPIEPIVSATPVIPEVPLSLLPTGTTEENDEESNSESDSESSSSDDDDDDTQFKLLLQQKAAEEARLKQLQDEKMARKAKKQIADAKKRQKEEQMAALKAQMEAMKAEQLKLQESDDDDDDDDGSKYSDGDADTPAILQPQPQSAVPAEPPVVPALENGVADANPVLASHNPFLRSRNGTSSTHDNNPFARHTTSVPTDEQTGGTPASESAKLDSSALASMLFGQMESSSTSPDQQ